MKTIFIIISIILTSCGVSDESTKEYFVDSELEPYVNKFQKIYNQDIDNLVVVFTEETNHLGYCDIRHEWHKKMFNKTIKNYSPTIYINAKKWPILNYAQREAIMFHELGHCVLNRSHKDDVFEALVYEMKISTIYSSIMYPTVFSNGDIGNRAYIRYYRYYLAELFKRPISEFEDYYFDDSDYQNVTQISSDSITEIPKQKLNNLHELCDHK